MTIEAPGWYGKLPTLGDFASRRLGPAFIEAWDAWLAAGISRLREADSVQWLPAYLVSPSWRFLLTQGALQGEVGTKPWVGVLMPSVDRVGRYYPLTIAQQLQVLPSDEADCQQLSDWCDRVVEIAVAALFDDWTVDRLEAALHKLPPPAASTGVPPQTSTMEEVSSLADWLGSLPIDTDGATFWRSNGDDEHPAAFTAQGLPSEAGFAVLFAQSGAQPNAPRISPLI